MQQEVGDGKAYIDRKLVYHTYLQVLSVKKTAELCNCDADTVSSILKGYDISKEDMEKYGA